MSVFGIMMPAHVIEDAVSETIKLWIHDYLGDLADQWSRPVLPDPNSYNVRPTGVKWNEDQFPAIVVVSPGTIGTPAKSGDGLYEADFVVGVIAFCLGNDEDSARRNSQDYEAALRLLILDKCGLGGMCYSRLWTGSDYTPGDTDGRRTLGAATAEFRMTINAVAQSLGGPSTPSTPPGTTWGIVESTDLTVSKLSTEDD